MENVGNGREESRESVKKLGRRSRGSEWKWEEVEEIIRSKLG